MMHTTYRTTTFRTPERASHFPVCSKTPEVLQLGAVPPPMYASTITSLKTNIPSRGIAVLVGGNRLANVAASPIQIMMGLKDIWKEESSGEIYTLSYNLAEPSFLWEKKPVQISPRANHSTMIVDYKLFIFGGTDYTTNLRHDIRPIIIDTVTWTKTISIVEADFPDKFLSGHSFLQIDNNRCLAAGGYNCLMGGDKDTPSDELIQLTVDDEDKVKLETLAMGSAPTAQSAFLVTPEPDVYILAGGTQERWALLSKYVAPGAPCDLNLKKRCLLVNNQDQYMMDTVNWLGCDGPCKRWFHVICLKISDSEFQAVSKRRKWFCNLSDCK